MTCTCRTTCKVRHTRTGLTFRAVLCSRFTAGVRGTSHQGTRTTLTWYGVNAGVNAWNGARAPKKRLYICGFE
jgi:hypothetical protein